MTSLPQLPYTQQADVALGIRVNGQFIWYSFMATVIGNQLPFVRGGASGREAVLRYPLLPLVVRCVRD